MNDDYFIARKNPDLIPISVIEGIRAEIKSLKADFDKFDDWRKKDGLFYALEIIDRHIKEYKK